VFVALALLASLPRAIDVADHDIAMDEVDQIMKSVEFLKDQSLTESGAIIQMPPTEILLTQFNYQVFGHSVVGYRWHAFVSGSLVAVFAFFLALLISGSALWSGLCFAFFVLLPMSVHHSTIVRPYSSGLMFLQLMLIFFVMSLQDPKKHQWALAASCLFLLQTICMQSQVVLFVLSSLLILRSHFGSVASQQILRNKWNWIAVAVSIPNFVFILYMAFQIGLTSFTPNPEVNREPVFRHLRNVFSEGYMPFQDVFFGLWVVCVAYGLIQLIVRSQRHRCLDLVTYLTLPLGFLTLVMMVFLLIGNYAAEPRFVSFLGTLVFCFLSWTVANSPRIFAGLMTLALAISLLSNASEAARDWHDIDYWSPQWSRLYSEIQKLGDLSDETTRVLIVRPNVCKYGRYCHTSHGLPESYPFSRHLKTKFFHAVSSYKGSNVLYDNLDRIEKELRKGDYQYIVYYQATQKQIGTSESEAPVSLIAEFEPEWASVVNKNSTPWHFGFLMLKQHKKHRAHQVYEHLVSRLSNPRDQFSLRDSLIDYYIKRSQFREARGHIEAFRKFVADQKIIENTRPGFLVSNSLALAQSQLKHWEQLIQAKENEAPTAAESTKGPSSSNSHGP
jgi:hypothetical protein